MAMLGKLHFQRGGMHEDLPVFNSNSILIFSGKGEFENERKPRGRSNGRPC